MSWLDEIKWDDRGLVPAIAQDYKTGENLMVAWMNRESLELSVAEGRAIYWSRSRQKLWHKGEQSGHQQIVKSIRMDCDNDAILLEVIQKGGTACHTGRHHCFFNELQSDKWQAIDPVL